VDPQGQTPSLARPGHPGTVATVMVPLPGAAACDRGGMAI